MEARTVVMGDWGRVVRDPIDILRATFFIGAAAFLALLVAWTKYGWGSVRRIPGENRAEDVYA